MRGPGLVAVLACVLGFAVPASAVEIQAVLGPSGNTLQASAVNEEHVVTGSEGSKIYRWKAGVATELSGGFSAAAYDINDAGAVAGTIVPTAGGDVRRKREAVVWPAGSDTPTVLPRLDPEFGGEAYSIDPAGNAVGYAQRLDQGILVDTPVRWPGPQILSNDGIVQSRAVDVNAAGTVLLDNARVWSNGVVSDLSCLSFAGGGGRHALNDSGVVVGAMRAAPGTPARWENGTCTPLPLLPGHTQGGALAINNAGVAVGYSRGADFASQRVVTWSPTGEITDLSTLLPPGSGWDLDNAVDITENEAVLGYGTGNGKTVYFLLTQDACPLPSTARRGPRAAATRNCPVVVTRTTDEPDAEAADGACDTDTQTAGAQCTLRAAIQEANRRTGEKTSITFALASPTITVGAALPEVTVTIDVFGGSQAGGGPVRIVSAPGGAYPGLVLQGTGSTLRKLVIGGFGSDGVVLGGQGKHTIIESFIGTDPSGCGGQTGAACALGNAGAGVRITSSGNLAGTDVKSNSARATDANVIANNRGAGFAITAGDGNLVPGNSIHDNGGLSIDLGDDGPTANDHLDADSGPNGLLNAAIITTTLPLVTADFDPATSTLTAKPTLRIGGTVETSPTLFSESALNYTLVAYVDPAGCRSFYGGQAVERSSNIESGPLLNGVAIGKDGIGSVYANVFAPDSATVVVAGVDPAGNTSELSNCFLDRDEDGINDLWETSGADLDRDGKVEVDLPAMGASPMHKDLFVELDWMASHEVDDAGLQQVRAAFADAPVENLDGRPGIALHLDNGPDRVMDPATGKTWGTLSGGSEIPRQPETGSSTISTEDFQTGFAWASVDALAAQHFNPDRKLFFHYSLSVARLRTPGDDKGGGSLLGVSQGIPGRQFLFGLQPMCPDATPCAGTPALQASVFMHELGHNLGFAHGGNGAVTPHLNFKPNFFSIMNYLYIPESLHLEDTPRLMDYSRIGTVASPGASGWTGDLNEKAIVEKDGFAARGRAVDSPAAWVCPAKPGEALRVLTAPRLSGGQDFDCDGKVSDTPAQIDLTMDKGPDGKSKPDFTLLEGTSEWDKINLRGGIGGELAVGAVPQPEGVAGDLPLKLLRSIARAKAHDRHEPKLAFRVLKKRRLRISATDDRRVEALEITVDKRRILVRAPAKRAKVRKLTKTLKLKKGRHAVRAVAYDTAYGSTEKQRRVRIRGR